MNRRTARSFALGVLFAVLALWSGNYFLARERTPSLTIPKAKEVLDAKGYIVLSKAEYGELKKAAPKDSPAEDKEMTIPEKQADKAETGSVPEEEKVYNLQIAAGMSPVEIADVLEREQIIKDAYEFERFLIDKGYHTKVQLGTFELKSSMDLTQLANIITKS